MTKQQRILSALYELQDTTTQGCNFSKILNELVVDLERQIQKGHLIPLL
jgi:hypothetical protein